MIVVVFVTHLLSVALAQLTKLIVARFTVPRISIRFSLVAHQAPRLRRFENRLRVNVDLNSTLAAFAYRSEVHRLIVRTPRMFNVNFCLTVRTLMIEAGHITSPNDWLGFYSQPLP